MSKNLIAEKLYPWERCIPSGERSDWELLTYNPDDFFGTSMLFQHRELSAYAVGAVSETSGGECFHVIPLFFDIFFAVRQTEDIWVILAFDGSDELLLRLRFAPGREPDILTAQQLPGEVSRCVVNRRGHILIGYDNGRFFSDTQNTETIHPVADLSLPNTFPGKNGMVLSLLEWYDFNGNLLHIIADNMNTAVTELTIDSEDRALVALDLSHTLVRLDAEKISFEEKKCLHSRTIEGITEAGDHSGYLLSFTEELSEVSIPGGPQQPQTVWLSSGSEDPVTCRAFSEDGEELPMDSYSCRGNTILIEDDGWIFRIIL